MKHMILRWFILACAFLAGGCSSTYTVSGPATVAAPPPSPCPSPSPDSVIYSRGGTVARLVGPLCGAVK